MEWLFSYLFSRNSTDTMMEQDIAPKKRFREGENIAHCPEVMDESPSYHDGPVTSSTLEENDESVKERSETELPTRKRRKYRTADSCLGGKIDIDELLLNGETESTTSDQRRTSSERRRILQANNHVFPTITMLDEYKSLYVGPVTAACGLKRDPRTKADFLIRYIQDRMEFTPESYWSTADFKCPIESGAHNFGNTEYPGLAWNQQHSFAVALIPKRIVESEDPEEQCNSDNKPGFKRFKGGVRVVVCDCKLGMKITSMSRLRFPGPSVCKKYIQWVENTNNSNKHVFSTDRYDAYFLHHA